MIGDQSRAMIDFRDQIWPGGRQKQTAPLVAVASAALDCMHNYRAKAATRARLICIQKARGRPGLWADGGGHHSSGGHVRFLWRIFAQLCSVGHMDSLASRDQNSCLPSLRPKLSQESENTLQISRLLPPSLSLWSRRCPQFLPSPILSGLKFEPKSSISEQPIERIYFSHLFALSRPQHRRASSPL